MRTHHTKTKGDLGVAAAVYDLTKKGFIVCWPMTEHAPYDLIAERDGVMLRVQVKYRTESNGVIVVQFLSVWVDRKRIHVTPMDRSSVDIVVVFCPDTDRCYYLDPSSFEQTQLKLRIRPTANNQAYAVNQASDFLEIPERFRHARQDSNLRTPI